MQKPSKLSQIPQIRFAGFTKPWEIRKLEDCMETITDYVAAGSFANIASNVKYKNTPDYAQLIRTIDLKYKFNNNDFVYVDKKAFSYLWRVNLNTECIILPNIGNIGEVYYVEPSSLPYKHNVLGPNAIYLKSVHNVKFIYSLFQATDFQNKLLTCSTSSGRSKFNKTELKEIQIILPNLQEQQKIGELFANLDNLITLHQRKVEKLQKIKKSCLQNLFPQNNQNTPKIRFKNFSDEWVENKLEKIANRFDNLRIPISADKRISGSIPYYGANGIQDYVKGYTHNGEFILIAEDGANDLKNYPVQYVNGKFWANNHTHVVQAITEIANNKFLKYAISQINIERILVGGGRAKLNANAMMDLCFNIPNLTEQEKIGAFFAKLDKLISLQQRKVEKLKKIKAAMLSKAFI